MRPDSAKANAAAQAGRTVSDAEFEAEVNRQFGSVDAYKQALKEQYIVNQYVMLKLSDVIKRPDEALAIGKRLSVERNY